MIEAYCDRQTPVHRIDPRVKVVLVVLFSGVVAGLDRFGALAGALLMGAAWVAAVRIPLADLLRRLVPVNLFVLFVCLFLPFTVPGEPLFNLWGLVGSRAGLSQGLQIALKSNALMLLLLAVVASTPVFTLGHAMLALGFPSKLVHLLLFTYRYIHVMYREYGRLTTAMRIRGFRPRTDMHTYRTYAYLVGMILVRSADRARRVYDAMRCRGFRGNFYSLSRFTIHGSDVAILLATVGMLFLLGVWNWTTI